MHLKYRNINTAFRKIVQGIESGLFPVRRSPSRNGEVIRITEPLIVTYEKPCERVLFNQARDASPFFHTFESLYFLAGRNDLAPLQYYISDYGKFSDDGRTLNGSYGWRWRCAAGVPSLCTKKPEKGEQLCGFERPRIDQLQILINHLRRDPNSRRAVLQIWNVESDLLKIDSSKDVCCNISCVFEIREEQQPPHVRAPKPITRYLDMTVFNRSNDIILGMLGANAVHFSFLLEYMACCLGVEVGQYHQVTSNAHVYTWNWKPEEWLADETPDWYTKEEIVKTIPLVQNQDVFDKEVRRFIDHDWSDAPSQATAYQEPFLRLVAEPMCRAFYMHKQNRDYEAALHWVEKIEAEDWSWAALQWILKRQRNWMSKTLNREQA